MRSAATITEIFWREPLRGLGRPSPSASWSGSRSLRTIRCSSSPFATSIVLVIGSPEAEPAQPRALIGGHVVATLAGLAVLELTGPQAWAAAAAVGLAVLAMHATGTFHPSAGINPGLKRPSLVVFVRAGAGRRSAKKALGVPADLASCHTSKVDGYVMEGHVPAAAVRRHAGKAAKWHWVGCSRHARGITGDGDWCAR
jgi:HPP family/Protein of unknown function, DUF